MGKKISRNRGGTTCSHHLAALIASVAVASGHSFFLSGIDYLRAIGIRVQRHTILDDFHRPQIIGV